MTETTPSPSAPTPAPVVSGAQAELGKRIAAFAIDIVIAMLLASVLSGILGKISGILGFLASFTGIAYIVLRDALPFLDGQSLGKKALGLRAVTTQGASLSGDFSAGLVRNVVLAIPFFAIVELVILITKKDAPEGLLRLGDQWAGTKVINA